MAILAYFPKGWNCIAEVNKDNIKEIFFQFYFNTSWYQIKTWIKFHIQLNLWKDNYNFCYAKNFPGKNGWV